MLIDCDSCRVRGVGCADCVISLLFGAEQDSPDLDAAETAAFEVLAAAGLTPPLRLVPVNRAGSVGNRARGASNRVGDAGNRVGGAGDSQRQWA